MLRKSIIVIDDELLIRDLLYDFFSERNWVVAVYESGEKCLEALRNRSFDIALVDIKMSDMDGLSLAHKIRDLYPSLPVVLMTAFPSVDSAVDALRLKVEDYFTKPFNINKLYKSIEAIADQRGTKSETPRSEKIPL